MLKNSSRIVCIYDTLDYNFGIKNDRRIKKYIQRRCADSSI